MGPGSVWTGGDSRPHRVSIPDRPAHSLFAIPTELPGPRILEVPGLNIPRRLRIPTDLPHASSLYLHVSISITAYPRPFSFVPRYFQFIIH